jgi:hypothetical protein
MNQKFKAAEFAADILKKRESKTPHITYAKASAEMKISASILHRAESGLPVSLDSFAIICNWMGKKVQNYF